MAEHLDYFGTVTPDVALDPAISTTAKAVYLVLAVYRNRVTGEAFPSNATIARNLGIHRDTVKRAISELADHGVVERIPRFMDGRQTTSLTKLIDASALRKRKR